MESSEATRIAGFRTSPLLTHAGFRHAFFTRKGGVSSGPYASLSFSVAAGDTEANVTTNLARAASALGVEADRVYYLSQVHGATALVIDGTEDRREILYREGDALVGQNPRAAVGVRIADCVPILVADRRSGAVAAIHAGWRGLVRGMVAEGIAALRREAGGDVELVAAIGPHITGPAFEVEGDVAEELARASHAEHVVERVPGSKPHVHLARIARALLEDAGVAAASIDLVEGCTYSDPGDFFSFRRDGKESGRHLAAIVPRQNGSSVRPRPFTGTRA
jgi:YfiH family protein